MFQVSVPLSCLPKYSDNDVPGSTYLQVDSTIPEAIKCYHEMQFYEEGSQWRSKKDPCIMCNCHQNLVKCDTVPCPSLTCDSKTSPGECCPTCTSKSILSFQNIPIFFRDSSSYPEIYIIIIIIIIPGIKPSWSVMDISDSLIFLMSY